MVAQVNRQYIRTRPMKLWSRLVSYALFEGRPLTTRGQWINPLVFAHLACWKHLPQTKQVQQPVFILGVGRSGTTILGVLLSMHRDVGFLNEPKALWHAIYSNEDVIGSYNRGEGRYRLDADDADETVKRNAHRLFGAYLTSVFSKRLVDKYPELIFRVPFVRQIFPDAKFIFLVRNGWDTCASIDQWSSRLGKQKNGEMHNWWGVNRRKWNLLVEQLVPEHSDLIQHQEKMFQWQNDTDMAALEWIITMREGLKLIEEYPDAVMRINYEALCSNPYENLKKIADFIGLINDRTFFSYAIQTLKVGKKKESFELAPEIGAIFRTTMNDLGYVY